VSLGVLGAGALGRFVAVRTQQLDDRILREPEPVVHPETVGRRPLGRVEVDLLADTGQELAQAVGQITSGIGDSPVLDELQRVSGRPTHAWE